MKGDFPMKLVKKLSLLLVLAFILGSVSVPALARGSYLGYMRVVNCDSWVSLRSYASTAASRVAQVPLGAYVEAYYYNSEFTECYYNGWHGYILSTYLTGNNTSSAASSSSSYLGKKYIVNCKEFVTLRSSPSTSASAVTRVALGEEVDAYYYNGTFSKCYYNGLSGYILSKYLGDSYYYVPTYTYSVGDFLGNATVVNCQNWVTLRSAPSTKAGSVTKVPLGACVSAYYYNSEFTECFYNGMHGYILSTYLSTSASSSSNYLGKMRVSNCNEFVTLRSSPSTSASAVTRVALGEVVDAYYYNGTFTKCYYNGMSGYILSQYLR